MHEQYASTPDTERPQLRADFRWAQFDIQRLLNIQTLRLLTEVRRTPRAVPISLLMERLALFLDI
jgi:hypothetical protein